VVQSHFEKIKTLFSIDYLRNRRNYVWTKWSELSRDCNKLRFRVCPQTKQSLFREYKIKFKQMSDEEKSARARELWRILRRSVRNYIIFARLLRPEWKNLGQDLEKEDLGDG
jgi:hypothetical protein